MLGVHAMLSFWIYGWSSVMLIRHVNASFCAASVAAFGHGSLYLQRVPGRDAIEHTSCGVGSVSLGVG